MELVINIPKEQYTLIMRSHKSGAASFVSKEAMMYTIKNGTPLPEGHGKIGDLDEIRSEVFKASMDSYFMPIKPLSCDDVTKIIDNAPIIIEADKPKNGCCSCPHSGSIIDGYRDCPDAYTKQSQYCGFYNKGEK